MLFAASEGQGSGLLIPGVIILLMVAMYFFMVRPQNKRRKEMAEKQRQAGPGQTIVTIGGLHATIIETDDATVTLEISPGVMCVYERGAIARVLEDSAGDEASDDDVEPTSAVETSDTDAESDETEDATEDEEDSKKKSSHTGSDGKSLGDGTQN